MCVISCVKYVVSGASCPELCFSTPAVQISITNISPWLTPCFLSVKRPWLACIHVQIGPKSLAWNYVWMWVERYEWVHALIILQVPFFSFFDLSLLSCSSAGRHSSLQKEATSNEESLSDTDRLCFVSPFLLYQLHLFISPGSDEENTANKYMELWGKYLLPLVCFAEFENRNRITGTDGDLNTEFCLKCKWLKPKCC